MLNIIRLVAAENTCSGGRRQCADGAPVVVPLRGIAEVFKCDESEYRGAATTGHYHPSFSPPYGLEPWEQRMLIHEIQRHYIGPGKLTQRKMEKFFRDDGNFAKPTPGFLICNTPSYYAIARCNLELSQMNLPSNPHRPFNPIARILMFMLAGLFLICAVVFRHSTDSGMLALWVILAVSFIRMAWREQREEAQSAEKGPTPASLADFSEFNSHNVPETI